MWSWSLLLAAELAAGAAPVRHALVVGANDGGGVLPPLRYAENDAENMASVLVELGDFDERLVTVLYAPNQDQLRAALAAHAAIAEQYEDDLFLFYYSGHADASGLRLAEDRYFFETLKHDVRRVDSSLRIGILDACRSGSITRLKGADIGESLFGTEELSRVEGEAWLTAAAADESAQESDALRGGFFTHYLISGMRGAADDNDQIVDLGELKRYTLDEVVANTWLTQKAQHPHFDYDMGGTGEVAITDLRRGSALITLPTDVAGRITVLRRPDNVQIVELAKHYGQELVIAVPPGAYRALRHDGDSLYSMGVELGEKAQVKLDSWGEATMTINAERSIPDDRVAGLVDESQRFERSLNLGQSPALAGLASLVIPGAGQIYNGQIVKGALYFGASAALMAGTLSQRGGELDLGTGLVGWPLGIALWGASVADGAFNVHRREEARPMGGGTFGWSAGMGGSPSWPFHVGFSSDLFLRKGLSIGLDRAGYTPYGDGGFDAHVGSRLMIAHEGPRLRPGAFVALGIRHGRAPHDTLKVTRAVFGAGADLRYYVVPRYFTELELRWEQGGDHSGLVTGVGLGVHLGR